VNAVLWGWMVLAGVFVFLLGASIAISLAIEGLARAWNGRPAAAEFDAEDAEPIDARVIRELRGER